MPRTACSTATIDWCSTWRRRSRAPRARFASRRSSTESAGAPAGVDVAARGALGGTPSRVRARAALITLPLGVLQAPRSARGAVRFVPALPPAKRRAIERLAMGNVIKVVLRLRQPVGVGVLAPLGRDMSFVHLGRRAGADLVGAAAVSADDAGRLGRRTAGGRVRGALPRRGRAPARGAARPGPRARARAPTP